MVTIRFSTKDDIEALMKSRFEMLRVVNDLSDEYRFSDELIKERTESGRPLYESLGFTDSEECMVLTRKQQGYQIVLCKSGGSE